MREKLGLSFGASVYERLVAIIESGGEEEVPFKVCDQIDRDLKRTHLSEKISFDMGIDQMKRNLQAIAYCFKDVGYCQGMNYITATLLELTNNEEISFWLFYVLIENFEMKQLYLPGVPDLHMRNYMMS